MDSSPNRYYNKFYIQYIGRRLNRYYNKFYIQYSLNYQNVANKYGKNENC